MVDLSEEERFQLQRKYSGLNDDLSYIPGHTINNKYKGYKSAGEAAGEASTNYKKTSASLALRKPYAAGSQVKGPVASKMFNKEGHQTLEPIAGAAATAAGFHADRRESFNQAYKPLLEAKGKWDGHDVAAQLARNSEQKHRQFQQKHQDYARQYQQQHQGYAR